jgi:hypothetical protein
MRDASSWEETKKGRHGRQKPLCLSSIGNLEQSTMYFHHQPGRRSSSTCFHTCFQERKAMHYSKSKMKVLMKVIVNWWWASTKYLIKDILNLLQDRANCHFGQLVCCLPMYICVVFVYMYMWLYFRYTMKCSKTTFLVMWLCDLGVTTVTSESWNY